MGDKKSDGVFPAPTPLTTDPTFLFLLSIKGFLRVPGVSAYSFMTPHPLHGLSHRGLFLGPWPDERGEYLPGYANVHVVCAGRYKRKKIQEISHVVALHF